MDYSKLIDYYLGRKAVINTDYKLESHDYGVTTEIMVWNITDKSQPAIAELEALQPQLDIIENNESIKAQIAELETKQPRALREFALGYDGAQERLQSIENQIAQLRTQLQE